MCAMPLTLTRPVAAKLLGISVAQMNTDTESGKIPVVWRGSRRSVSAGTLADIAGITVSELSDLYEKMFGDPPSEEPMSSDSCDE